MSQAVAVWTHRLPQAPGQVLDRSQSIEFTFDGATYRACPGDTIASALYAAGVRTFSRSFKYHRRRGLLCASGDCPNCLVQVGQEPSVRACRRPVSPGMQVRSQNRWPSLELDAMSLVQLVSRFLPPGFYYKAFMRPRALWPAYEQFLRRASGLGHIERDAPSGYSDKQYRHAEVAVVGGGPAGLAAALAAAEQGARTLLLDDNRQLGGHLRYRRGSREGQSYAAYRDELAAAAAAHPRLELLAGATALGYYGHNWIGAALEFDAPNAPAEAQAGTLKAASAGPGSRLVKLRAGSLIVATGAREIPLVFKGNDLPGVMLPGAAQRLIRLWGVRPGRRAVVVAANRHALGAALDLLEAGVELAAVADLREQPDPDLTAELEKQGVPVMPGAAITAAEGRRQVSRVWLAERPGSAPRPFECDLVIASAGLAPVNDLLFQAGAKLAWDPQRNQYLPQRLPEGVYAAGQVAGVHELDRLQEQARRLGAAAAGRSGTAGAGSASAQAATESGSGVQADASTTVWSLPPLSGDAPSKAFVCYCEDVTRHDLEATVAEGYDSVELLKRYSTVSMGPCQGKMCNVAVMHACAGDTRRTVAETGTTTSRPPARSVPIRTLAGRPMDPVRHTPLHQWHLDHGARMMVAGQWMRPEHYGDPVAEVRAVRQQVGLIDVSTLGKFHLHGPDASELLSRVYTNRWRKLGVGRVRYGLMVNEEGVVMNDGVTAHLDPDTYYMTTTSGGAAAVHQWMEWWLQSGWQLAVHLHDATELRAAMNLTGPRAREVLAVVAEGVDLDNQAFPYMHVRQARLAGAPALLLRIGFTGELGYEIHTPSGYAAQVWQALMEAGVEFGIAPFGVEAQRVLRLEKGHIIVGQDTDSLTNPLQAGMDWAVKLDKPDFLGRPSLAMAADDELQRSLVGFEVPSGVLVQEANQIVRPGSGPIGLEILGRITSVRRSPTLERVIGLAWLPAEMSEPGNRFTIRSRGQLIEGRVAELPFYDPEGARLRG